MWRGRDCIGVLESTGVVDEYAHCDLAWGGMWRGRGKSALRSRFLEEEEILARTDENQATRLCYTLCNLVIALQLVI